MLKLDHVHSHKVQALQQSTTFQSNQTYQHSFLTNKAGCSDFLPSLRCTDRKLGQGLQSLSIPPLSTPVLQVCVLALIYTVLWRPVDPEVEEQLAQEATVVRPFGEQSGKVRPPCGYGLLQAKEEARKVRALQSLMRVRSKYLRFIGNFSSQTSHFFSFFFFCSTVRVSCYFCCWC